MNGGKEIFISRRASSRKTPETASAAEHGLRKRLTVLLLIQGRSNNFLNFFSIDFDYDFFLSLSLAGKSSFSCACLYTATELVNF